MGQYYNIATSSVKNGAITCHSVQVETKEYTGVKLMEHSYYGNDTMNAVCAFLFKNKKHIAWVGDYADTDERINAKKRHMLYKACWGGAKELPWKPAEESDKWKYLVNHTKHVYLDLDKNRELVKDSWGDHEFSIHPLPLLTAVGNGQGGGDYHEQYANFEHTGSWAWDAISIEEEIPENYLQVWCPFKECSSEDLKEELESLTIMDLPKGAVKGTDYSVVRVGESDYSAEYVNDSWAEAHYYMLVQRDGGGDIPLAVDVGSNGRKNLEFMRDNEYSPGFEYAIVKITPSEYFTNGIDLGYTLFDLATDAVRNMGIKNNK